MIQSLRAMRTAALLILAGAASASAQIAQDAAVDVPVPPTILLLGAAAGAAMLVRAYRNRR
jgi:hypothetical protein